MRVVTWCSRRGDAPRDFSASGRGHAIGGAIVPDGEDRVSLHGSPVYRSDVSRCLNGPRQWMRTTRMFERMLAARSNSTPGVLRKGRFDGEALMFPVVA